MHWLNSQEKDRTLSCAYCGYTGLFQHAMSYEHSGETLSLYTCSSCKSLAYNTADIKFPIETHSDAVLAQGEAISQDAWRVARYHIEAGFSSRHVAMCALAALPDGSAASLRKFTFVDVGAGFGMASHLVKSLFGMSTVTVEPSFTGKLSNEILGLSVHRAYFEHLPPDLLAELATKPCCLHLNSVVEHLANPFVILKDMISRVKVRTLAVIVPDGDALDVKGSFVAALPFLSPRDHRHLPSKKGLDRLLRRLGFEHVHIDQEAGLLTGVGSRSPIIFPSERTIGLAEQVLLENLIRHPNRFVAEGGVSRILPIAVTNKNDALMADLRARLPYESQVDAYLKRIADRSWDDLPFHLGPSCYWLALHAFISGRPDGALSLLDVTVAFADLIAGDYPELAMTSVEFKWAAFLLKGNILSSQTRGDAAKAALNEILASRSDAMYGARTLYIDQAQAALSALQPPAPAPENEVRREEVDNPRFAKLAKRRA